MGALSERASLLETTVGAPGRTEAGFTIRVAADVGVQKVNVEVTFAAHPTSLPALIAALQASFIWDWHGDGHVHPIDVSHILLWGDLDHEWRYLCHHNDLAPADQIYLFQKYQTTYTPGALPAPRVRIHAGEPINFREQGRVRVAADMFGRKVNYNIRYEQLPTTLEAFRTDCEKLLTCEALYITPKGVTPADVVVEDMLLWDEGVDQWLDLTSARYLQDGAQVYCHQREVVEIEGNMPAPAVTVPGGEALSNLWRIFFLADTDKRGYLQPQDLKYSFNHLGLGFPDSSYDEMFEALDRNQDGRAHFSEFCQLGLLYPSIVKYLCLMADEQQEHWKRRANFKRVERDVKKQLHKTRVRESELLRHQAALVTKREREDTEHQVVLVASGVSEHAGLHKRYSAPHEVPLHPHSVAAGGGRISSRASRQY